MKRLEERPLAAHTSSRLPSGGTSVMGGPESRQACTWLQSLQRMWATQCA